MQPDYSKGTVTKWYAEDRVGEQPSAPAPQPSILQISDIQRLIFSNLDSKSISILGRVSKGNTLLYKSHLISLLNTGKIAIKDVGVKSITEAINFFGKENCLKITRLNLTDLYRREENSTTYCKEIEKVNISESFPNLKHFCLSRYSPEKKLDIKDLCLPKKLESLCLSTCKVADWSFIKDLSLKTLDISCNYIKNEELEFLKELELENLDISSNSLNDSTVLNKLKSKLISLNIKNTSVDNISFIKEFASLTTFSFGHSYNHNHPMNPSLLASLHVLQECSSLKNLDIAFNFIKKEFLDSLKLPRLEHLSLNLTANPDFLSVCTSLKSINCGFTNLSFLEKCPGITKLKIYESTGHLQLHALPYLQNLEEIELQGITVENLSVLGKLPSLKKVIHHMKLSKESVEALTSKGIKVIKKQ